MIQFFSLVGGLKIPEYQASEGTCELTYIANPLLGLTTKLGYQELVILEL
jgi:hypothetical protein